MLLLGKPEKPISKNISSKHLKRKRCAHENEKGLKRVETDLVAVKNEKLVPKRGALGTKEKKICLSANKYNQKNIKYQLCAHVNKDIFLKKRV